MYHKKFYYNRGYLDFHNFKKMKYKFIISLLLLFSNSLIFAQADGFWDTSRSTTKEVILSAGERTLVVSENFPEGTTELAFRITSLDGNQKLSSSLISLLQSIPDPSGLSQGSAGAVLLLSQISGDDKSVYSIFSNLESAQKFQKTGKNNQACFIQDKPVNKDAKLISIEKDPCFTPGLTNLYLIIESKNWMLKQKVVVEIVPWVDFKSSKGWNINSRKEIIDLCKTSNLAQLMINSDDFCVCILEQFQNNYKYDDYNKLLAMEKSKIYKNFGDQCLQNSVQNASILRAIRLDSYQYFKNGNLDKAIKLLQSGIIDQGNATAIDHNNIGKYYLYTKQFAKALKSLKEAQSLDDSELMIQMNLAHLYLLQNDFSAARNIHKKFKEQNVTASLSWKTKALEDFNLFIKNGFKSELFEKIIKYLEQ